MEKKGFQSFIERVIVPIAEVLEKQKHLQAIKDGMVAVVPILIIGSFSIIPIGIKNLLGSGAIHDFIVQNLDVITLPAKFTSDLLSLYAVYFIAHSLAKKYELKNTSYLAITAVIVHLIVATNVINGATLDGNTLENILMVRYLGAEGLFTGMLVALLTVEVSKLMYTKRITIRLPESVPSMVASSFDSLLPMAVNIFLAVAVTTITKQLSNNQILPEVIIGLLGPVLNSMDSLPAMLLIVFLTQLFWFFGLHGPAITSAIWVPFAIQYGGANVAAVAAGNAPVHFFTFGFYYSLLQVTGSGLTLGLVLLMLKSKSKSLSSMAKVSLIPPLFGINEPVIFGTPLVLNPFMFIPFVFGPLLVTITSYFAMSLKIVGMPIAEPPSFMPPGIGAFIMTLDYKAVILVFINLAMMTLIYYPFFKSMEKHELQKEQMKEG